MGEMEGCHFFLDTDTKLHASEPLGYFFGYLICLTKLSKCLMSCAELFVDQIVFCVRVRKVNLNKLIFNDSMNVLQISRWCVCLLYFNKCMLLC